MSTTRLDLPIPCFPADKASVTNFGQFNIDSMVVGITSERAIEYKFLSRNLIYRYIQATIIDVGTGGGKSLA